MPGNVRLTIASARAGAPGSSTHLSGGEALLAEQDVNAALNCFDRALKLDPGAARAYFEKAEAALCIPKTPAEQAKELLQ